MNPKQKGRIFVFFQFLFIAVILAASVLEKKYTGRTNTYYIDLLAFLFLSAGFLVGILSILSMGQWFTPNPVPGEKSTLSTKGIYSIIRHPMYLSVLLFLLGLIFFFEAYYSLLIYGIVIIFFITKINFEEKQLNDRFPDYKVYSQKTKRIFPFIY